MKGPKFLKYINPVLNQLQLNGGAGNSSDIIEKVIEQLEIDEIELEETTSNGQSRVRNQIQWARFYLFKAGLIDNSERGIWRLTKTGIEANLDDEGVYSLFKNIQDNERRNQKSESSKNEDFEQETTEDEEHSGELLELIKNLSPGGFEKLCKRLLTEIGIKDIVITGGSNDKGIDGVGLVKLNDVVSLNIVSQCNVNDIKKLLHHTM